MGSENQEAPIDPTLISSRVQFGLIYSHPGGVQEGGFQAMTSCGITTTSHALDFALDISGTLQCDGSSIVGLLVKAGAVMTGNSRNYVDGRLRLTLIAWRRLE